MPREVSNAYRYLTQIEVDRLPEDWSCGHCLVSSKNERCIGHLVTKRNPSQNNPDLIERTGHVFHSACVEPWLQSSRGSCPICRQKYDYNIIPKQKSEWLKKIKSAAGEVLSFLKRPTIYTLYTGCGATITGLCIKAFPLFTLGIFLMSRGFAKAELEFKPTATYYKNELERLKSKIDELDQERDRAIEAMSQPGRSISFIQFKEIDTQLQAQRRELQRWEENCELRDQYNSHTISIVGKRVMLGFFLFSLYACLYDNFILHSRQRAI